ncbi:MAG: hypothetical protein LBU81_00370 [Methanosarcinales archaeon]|nr:hypothetical protein [Methanosarcinales archaeon]
MPPCLKATIMDMYIQRYLELGRYFYDLVKHDLKNYQSGTFTALDLYQTDKEEKYLSMVKKFSLSSLEYIEAIGTLEPFIYNGGHVGFYSIYSLVSQTISKYPNIEIKINGDDISVFADYAFLNLFDLMFQTAPENGSIHKVLLTISEFQEDRFNKCNLKIELSNFSYPLNMLEAILNDEADSAISDITGMAFYIAKMIHYRYLGTLKLTGSAEDKVILTATFLTADNPLFLPLEPSDDIDSHTKY